MTIAEQFAALKGKTIETVCAKACGRDCKNPFENIVLFFTDGTEVNITPSMLFHGDEEHQSESAIEIEFFA